MPQVDPVVVVIQADIRNYELNVSRAERLGDEKLGAIERQAGQMGKGVSRSFNLAAGAAKAYAVALKAAEIAQEYLRITDAAKSLEVQLRFATSETGNFAQATDDVRRIAAETRTGLEDTAQLYGRIVMNSRELGLSQEDAARATETFAKTVKISGASAEEASAATTKFAEALADGALSSDELQSILASSPRLASLLAESLGVTVTELYAMGQAGQLSADQLFAALTERKFTEQIDAEVRELPVTFSDAMTQVENAAILTFGAFDRGGQFSTAIANFITDGSDGFADLETAAEDFGAKVSSELAGVIAVAKEFAGWLQTINSTLGGFPKRFITDTAEVASYLNPIGLLGHSINRSPTYQAARGKRAGELAMQKILRTDPFEQFRAEGGKLPPRRSPAEESPEPIIVVGRKPDASSPGTRPIATPRPRSSPAATASNPQQEQDTQIREGYEKRREQAQLDDRLLAARAALAVAAEDILQFELDKIDSQKTQEEDRLRTQAEIGGLTEDERTALEEQIKIVGQIAEEQKKLAERKAEEAKAALKLKSLRDESDTLAVEAQIIRSREEQRDAAMRILDLQFLQEEEAIRSAAAKGEIANLDEALANLQRRRVAKEEQLKRDSASPAEKYLDELNDEAANLGDAYEEIAVRGLKRMNEEFTNAISKALGLHGVLGDIISDFIELAIRQAVIRPLAELLGGGGGGGGIFGAIFKGIGGLLGGGIGGGGGIQFGGNPLSLDTISVGLGRASGGYAEAGRLYRINEAASPGRVEGFVPQGSGKIIPLGQMNTPAAMPGGGSAGVVQIQVVEGQMFEPRVRTISGDVSVQTVRGAAPGLIDASARETIARSRRPTL